MRAQNRIHLRNRSLGTGGKMEPAFAPQPLAGWVHADVAQLVERLPSKQNVASSRLVIRSGAQAPLSVGPVWNGHHLVAGGDRGFKSRTEDDNDVGSGSCPRALCSGDVDIHPSLGEHQRGRQYMMPSTGQGYEGPMEDWQSGNATASKAAAVRKGAGVRLPHLPLHPAWGQNSARAGGKALVW